MFALVVIEGMTPTGHLSNINEIFFQNLLGLRAKTWKLLMNATSDLNEDWLRYKRDEIGHVQLYYLDMNAFLIGLYTCGLNFLYRELECPGNRIVYEQVLVTRHGIMING